MRRTALGIIILFIFLSVKSIKNGYAYTFWEAGDFAINIPEANIKNLYAGIDFSLYPKKQFSGLPNGIYLAIPLTYQVGLSNAENFYVKTGFGYTQGPVGKNNKLSFFLLDPSIGADHKFTIKNYSFIARGFVKLPLFNADFGPNNGAFEIGLRFSSKYNSIIYGIGYDIRSKSNDYINYGNAFHLIGGTQKEFSPQLSLLAIIALDYYRPAAFVGDADAVVAPPSVSAENSRVFSVGLISHIVYIINSRMEINTRVSLTNSIFGITTTYTYKGLQI